MNVEAYLNGTDSTLVKRKKDGTYTEIKKLKVYDLNDKKEKLVSYEYTVFTWQVLKECMGIGTSVKPKLTLNIIADGQPYTTKEGVNKQNFKVIGYQINKPEVDTNNNVTPGDTPIVF